MKYSLMLDVQSLRKVLKNIYVIFALCSTVVSAKIGGKSSVPRSSAQEQLGRTISKSQTQVIMPSDLKEPATVSEKDRMIEVLQTELQQLRLTLSAQTQLMNDIVGRKGQQVGLMSTLSGYRSAVSDYIASAKMKIAGGVLGTGAISAVAFGAVPTVIVGGAAAAAVYGFSTLADWITDRPREEQINAIKVFVGQEMLDLGKYPTYTSKIDALNTDFVNLDKAKIVDDVFQEAIRQLKEQLVNDRQKAFGVPGEQVKEDTINRCITNLRVACQYDIKNLKTYLENLMKFTLEKSTILQQESIIDVSRAITSEYLRTQSILERDNIIKQEPKTEEATGGMAQQPKASSWFSGWF